MSMNVYEYLSTWVRVDDLAEGTVPLEKELEAILQDAVADDSRHLLSIDTY